MESFKGFRLLNIKACTVVVHKRSGSIVLINNYILVRNFLFELSCWSLNKMFTLSTNLYLTSQTTSKLLCNKGEFSIWTTTFFYQNRILVTSLKIYKCPNARCSSAWKLFSNSFNWESILCFSDSVSLEIAKNGSCSFLGGM